MKRDYLVDMSLYQLAGAIRDDWREVESLNPEVDHILTHLSYMENPSHHIGNYAHSYDLLNALLSKSENWVTEDSEIIKKEIKSRLNEYKTKIQAFKKEQAEKSVLAVIYP